LLTAFYVWLAPNVRVASQLSANFPGSGWGFLLCGISGRMRSIRPSLRQQTQKSSDSDSGSSDLNDPIRLASVL
jgi:hypothetical protein